MLDIWTERSPVDIWYLKPWKAMRLFRGSKWAEIDSWDTNFRGGSGNNSKCEEFEENQENVLSCQLRGSGVSRRVESD